MCIRDRVHTAAAYAKMKNRLQTFVCTSSIGPGATNMITAAASATINRIPVLLLPGDFFSKRTASPLLQQTEYSFTQDMSVNDCFKPISKYWDRINRPEQLISSMLEAMRVLTSPSETGAVTIALPHDVQAETYEFPDEFFQKRIWNIPRLTPDRFSISKATEAIRKSKRPMIISGGGVIYSEAEKELKKFIEKTLQNIATWIYGIDTLLHVIHPSERGYINSFTLSYNTPVRVSPRC